jgi:chitinase
MRGCPIVVFVFALVGCGTSEGGSSLTDGDASSRVDAPAAGDAGRANGGAGGDPGVTVDGGRDRERDAGPRADGAISAGALPAKILGLYVYTNNMPRLATIQAQAPQYNVAYCAFGVGTNSGGKVGFSASSGGGEATFRSDIAAWKASGRVVLLSIGGGGDTGLRLQNASQGADFVSTVTPIFDDYGFQGIDWDLEQSGGYDVGLVVSISKQLKAKYGPGFIISVVPRPYEFRSYAKPAPYRQIAAQLGSDLDVIGLQFYDYPESNDAAKQKSIIEGDINDAIKDFPANKLLIGAEAPKSGAAWSPASVYRDAYAQMNGSTGGLRGAFIWDAHGEEGSGWAFATTMGPAVLGP